MPTKKLTIDEVLVIAENNHKKFDAIRDFFSDSWFQSQITNSKNTGVISHDLIYLLEKSQFDEKLVKKLEDEITKGLADIKTLIT
ncbi:MAG: hypothetical protein ABSB40_07260 [Nitrososphaeria archaeon]|jgi:hypothetical protein